MGSERSEHKTRHIEFCSAFGRHPAPTPPFQGGEVYCRKDGLGLQMAMKNGYKVVIISGASSEPVINRFRYLGITEIHLGIRDKLAFLQDFAEQNGLTWKEILFMGDDLPDVAVLEKVGLSCCPADAAVEVKKVSKYISAAKGGNGCVRDVIEKVLKLNDRWNYNTEISSR